MPSSRNPRRRLASFPLGLVAVVAAAVVARPAPAGGPPIDQQVWRGPIAPGVDLLAVRRLDGGGWLDLFALLVDLDTPGVRVDALTAGALTARQATSALAGRAGAMAAINGDFFYAGSAGTPVGLVVAGTRLWKGPDPQGRPSLALLPTPSGLRARIGHFRLEARVRTEQGWLALDGWNEPALQPGQIGAFDERWGTAALPLGRFGAGEVAYARLQSSFGEGRLWVVTAVGPGSPLPPATGELILLGWREGARRLLQALSPGRLVEVETSLKPADGQPQANVAAAVSGGSWLVRRGQVEVPPDAPGDPEASHPRAAAGVDREGRRLVLAVADGRRPESRGLSARELGEWMLSLGAYEALNLDGGGSATLVAELPGAGLQVINRPSDARERPVPVAIGVFYDPQNTGPGGQAAGGGPFVLVPATGLPVPSPHRYDFDFAGLTAAAGVPARVQTVPAIEPGSLLWAVDPPDLGVVARAGHFVGLRPGEGRIVAVRLPGGAGGWRSGLFAIEPGLSVDQVAGMAAVRQAAVAELPVRVIGPPARLAVEPSPLLVEPGRPVQLRAFVVDGQGRRAPLAPELVAWWLEGAAEGRIDGGLLEARPAAGHDPARLEARYLELRASVPIEWTPGLDGTLSTLPLPLPGIVPATGAGSLAAEARGAPEPVLDARARAVPPGPPPPGGIRVAVLAELPPPEAYAELGAWVRSASVGLLVTMTSGERATALGVDGSGLAAGVQVPLLWARIPDPAAPAPGEFMRRFGTPSAVATRGTTRFISIDRTTTPWGWFAGELRRALVEGISRLVVVAGSDPLTWPSSREGEMLHTWLAGAADRGLETWVLCARPDPGPAVIDRRDGVAYAFARERATDGEAQVLVLDIGPEGVELFTDRPGGVGAVETYAWAPQAPMPTHSSPSL